MTRRGHLVTAGGVAAFLVAGTVFISGLGSLPLMEPDEGRNAEVAREMAERGSWLVPTLEGLPYLDKPAAYFDAVALSLRAFGNDAWAARLPSVVCGFATLALLYAFSLRVYEPVTAALVVIVAGTAPLFIAFSRIVIMDGALCACTTAAILAGFIAEAGAMPDRRWHAAGAAAAGLGTLVKGPVGTIVPALVLVAFFVADGRPRALRRVFAPVNVAIVLGLVLPWFLLLVRAHPEFARYGLVEESLNRFLTPAFHRGKPLWFFLPVFLATLMPWTVLLAPMAVAAWRERARLTSADRLLVAWALVVLVFFSLSRTKQPAYILSGVVAAAALVGRGLGYAWRRRDGRASHLVARTAIVLAGMALAGAAALGWLALRGSQDGPSAWLGLVWPQLVCALLLMALCGLLAWRERRVGFAVAAGCVVQIALFTVALPGAAAYARARSVEPLAESLARVPQQVEIAAYEGYPAGLSFYLDRTITLIGDDAHALPSNFVPYWLRRSAALPATIVSSAGREAWISSRGNEVLVLAPAAQREALASWLGDRGRVHPVGANWWGAFIAPRAGR